MTMRVLHSIASIDPSYGGPANSLKGLMKALGRLGVAQAILTCSTGDPERDRINRLAFQGTDIIMVNPLIRRYYWTPFIRFKVGERLQGFDLYHVHGIFNGLNSMVCRLARAWNKPYIIEPCGMLSPFCLGKSRYKKKLSLALGELKNIENASTIDFATEGERQKFLLNFQAQRYIENGIGIDLNEFDRLNEPGTFRKTHNISDEEVIFFFLGRLQPIKGLEVLLPAFARWVKGRPERIRCVVAGPDEGGYRKRLENLAARLESSGIITFVGPLYGADRISAMLDSNVVCLPSFHENFGIAAVEGMACGKPVLISNQVDLWPQVKKFDLGEVAQLSFQGVTAALDRMILRRGEWPTIGLRGRSWVSQYCNWGSISKMVFTEYQRILEMRNYRFPI